MANSLSAMRYIMLMVYAAPPYRAKYRATAISNELLLLRLRLRLSATMAPVLAVGNLTNICATGKCRYRPRVQITTATCSHYLNLFYFSLIFVLTHFTRSSFFVLRSSFSFNWTRAILNSFFYIMHTLIIKLLNIILHT